MKKYQCEINHIHENLVNNAKHFLPNEKELSNLSDFFKIIGDGTRIKILWTLYKNEMCVCDISATLSMTKSAISHQLKVLREANLVKNRREGKEIFYSLADDHIEDILKIAQQHINE